MDILFDSADKSAQSDWAWACKDNFWCLLTLVLLHTALYQGHIQILSVSSLSGAGRVTGLPAQLRRRAESAVLPAGGESTAKSARAGGLYRCPGMPLGVASGLPCARAPVLASGGRRSESEVSPRMLAQCLLYAEPTLHRACRFQCLFKFEYVVGFPLQQLGYGLFANYLRDRRNLHAGCPTQ